MFRKIFEGGESARFRMFRKIFEGGSRRGSVCSVKYSKNIRGGVVGEVP